MADMSPQDKQKQAAAEVAAELVKDGMILGLGTGSTIAFFLDAVGRRVAKGLRVKGVPTSERTAEHCKRLGVELMELPPSGELDLAVDGADEIDRALNMIKGGGGALLREKMVASAARRVAIIVDSSKAVNMLGTFPLPIELVPFGHDRTLSTLNHMGLNAQLRQVDGAPYKTDNGNLIADCQLGMIDDPPALHHRLKGLVGVVETGLFIDLCHCLIIGHDNRVEVVEKN